MSRVIFRAGWPARGNRRLGWFWAWIGPYVVGTVGRWDASWPPRSLTGWSICDDWYDRCGHRRHRPARHPQPGLGRDGNPLTVEGRRW